MQGSVDDPATEVVAEGTDNIEGSVDDPATDALAEGQEDHQSMRKFEDDDEVHHQRNKG